MFKIYIIPIHLEFQLKRMNRPYPIHNDYYNMEEDFLLYLNRHRELLTSNPNKADWHYLPIFWTNWLVTHNHGTKDLYKLKDEVDKCIIDSNKTFTVCRYADGPVVSIGATIQFLCSRKTEIGIDIPNICSPHKELLIQPKKKYLASFVGALSTHKIRQRIAKLFENSKDILIVDHKNNEDYFVKTMLQSYIALCPRGYGGSSFRFYEAMQLGVVPFLIGDIDHRPFKKYIDWDRISFYLSNEKNLEEKLRSIDKQQAIEMGIAAKKVWEEELNYQKWCKYALKELETC